MKKNVFEKNTILVLIQCAVSIFSAIFSGLAFSSKKTTIIDSCATIVNSISSKNGNSKTFSLGTINKKETSESLVESYFISTFGTNFVGYHTEITTFVDQQGDMPNFSLFCGDFSRDNIKVCDAITYTNQVELRRFETCNINLLKEPNRIEELNTYGMDGVIYIPDYIAKYFVDNSGGELKTMSDLIPDYSKMSKNEIAQFLDKYSIKLVTETKDYGKYKISNIFYVDGFDCEYNYNDDQSGKLLKDFCGDFVIIPLSRFFAEDYNRAILSSFDTKKLIARQEIEHILAYENTCNVSLDFYCSINNKITKINVDVTEELSSQKTLIGLLIIPAILALLAQLYLQYKLKDFLNRFNPVHLIFYLILPYFLMSTILQLLRLTLFKEAFLFLCFNNFALYIAMAFSFMLSSIFIMQNVKRYFKWLR